jgi:hypothetical protein
MLDVCSPPALAGPENAAAVCCTQACGSSSDGSPKNSGGCSPCPSLENDNADEEPEWEAKPSKVSS